MKIFEREQTPALETGSFHGKTVKNVRAVFTACAAAAAAALATAVAAGITLVLVLALALTFSGCEQAANPASGVIPGAPEAPILSPADKQIAVSWPPAPGASSYEVYFSTVNSSTGAS
jgi:hypothetical protein